MKKLIIGLFVLGLTNLCLSQDLNQGIAAVELEGVVVTSPNYAYLNKVLKLDTPRRVKQLEAEAANFDVKEKDIYNRNINEYEITFNQPDGSIKAVYDKNGEIKSSIERFKNVKLPRELTAEIYKNHVGWKFHKDVYLVTYIQGNTIKRIYKVQLRKGDLKKTIKVNYDGELMK